MANRLAACPDRLREESCDVAWPGLGPDIQLLKLLQQPNPAKALTDYLAAVERLKTGTNDGKL